MKKKRNLILMVIAVLMAMTMMMPADVSAASVKVAKKSGAYKVTLSTGQIGYLATGKALKKGKTVKVKALKKSDRRSKVVFYGVTHKWSAKKISKALKKGLKIKATVKAGWSFYLVTRGKTRYVAYKYKTPAKPAKPATKPQPTKPSTTTQPSESTVTEPTKPEAPQTGAISITVQSTDPRCCGEAYSLEGTSVVLNGPNGNTGIALTADGTALVQDLPEGTYGVSVLTDTCNPAYNFAECGEVAVVAGQTAQIVIGAEPITCHLYFEITTELPESVTIENMQSGEVTVLTPKDDYDVSPLEIELPAGKYRVSYNGANLVVDLPPGWKSIEE